jgi:hypothetical protein
MGPDLINDKEIQIYGGSRVFEGQDAGSASGDNRWEIPGEPRTLLLSSGSKINARQRFYEVWADGCAHVSSSNLQTIEAVIFTHACSVLNGIFHDGTACDFHLADHFFGTADLCVKRKVPQIETVLTSRALFSGKSAVNSMNIHFKMDHDDEGDKESIMLPYLMETEPVLRHDGCAAAGVRAMMQSAEGFPLFGFGAVMVPAGGFRKPYWGNQDVMGSGFLARITCNEKEETSGILWICS